MSTAGLDLACQELVELVTDYLSGAMPASERARVEQHLLQCAGCTRYLAQMRATVTLTGRLRDESPPASIAPHLLAAFRRRKEGKGK